MIENLKDIFNIFITTMYSAIDTVVKPKVNV